MICRLHATSDIQRLMRRLTRLIRPTSQPEPSAGSSGSTLLAICVNVCRNASSTTFQSSTTPTSANENTAALASWINRHHKLCYCIAPPLTLLRRRQQQYTPQVPAECRKYRNHFSSAPAVHPLRVDCSPLRPAFCQHSDFTVICLSACPPPAPVWLANGSRVTFSDFLC